MPNQTKPKNKDNFRTKYATLVFRYREKDGVVLPNATRLLNTIADTIYKYNANSATYGYSQFDFHAFYIDEEDMSIEEQNQKYNELCVKE